MPVTASAGQTATAVDRTREIYGAMTGKSGAWSVTNLVPGNYVIEFLPYYLGQENEYLVGTSSPGSFDEDLGAATIYEITAGHTTAAPKGTALVDSDESGAGLTIQTDNTGNTVVAGAIIDVYSDSDGLDYVSGVSNSSGNVSLEFGDGTPLSGDGSAENVAALAPGDYTIKAVDPTGAHAPVILDTHLYYGHNAEVLHLATVGTDTPAPGFSTAPSINTSTAKVGTSYKVLGAVSARSDSTITYQWLRDGKPIYGYTSTSGNVYVASGADYNHHLSVRVTVSSFGFADYSTTLDVGGSPTSLEALGDAPVNVTPPTIVVPAGGVVDGSTLWTTTGAWTVDGLYASDIQYSYSWSPGGAGSSSSTFKPSDQNIQDLNPITVSVTAYAPGYAAPAAPATSSSVSPSYLSGISNTKAPKVTSKKVTGGTVFTVSNGSWNTSGLTYTYAWVNGESEYASSQSFDTTGTLTVPASGPLTVTVYAHKLGYYYGQVTVLAEAGTSSPSQTATPTVKDVTSGVTSTGPSTTLTYGDKLTVTDPGTWSFSGSNDTPTSVSYQWSDDSGPIKGATSASYTISGAAVAVAGTPISVTQSAKFADGATFVGTPRTIGAVALATFSNASPLVTITGTPTAGQKLTANGASWGTTGVTDTYQWYDCTTTVDMCSNEENYSPVAGAIKSTYTTTPTELGVYVVVTGTKSGYTMGTSNSDETEIYATDQLVATKDPSISGASSGNVYVGSAATAVAPTWSMSGVTTTYAWQLYEDGEWTTVATGSKYTPTAADQSASEFIRVLATGKKGAIVATDGSAASEIANGTLKVVKVPSIKKTSSGYVLSTGTYSASAGATNLVSWEVDGTAVGDANGDTLALTDVEAGEFAYADIIEKVPGYNWLYENYIVAQKGTLTASAETITDSNDSGPAFGDTLTVGTANPFSSADGSLQGSITPTYQWYANGKAISKATALSYTPTSAYVGKTISVKVTGSSAYYTSYSTVAVEDQTLAAAGFPYLPDPALTSSTAPAPGVALSVNIDTPVYPSTTTYKYVWQRSTDSGSDWTTIAGATKSSYTPVATDVTDQIRAIVTVSAPGYGSLHNTIQSDAATIGYAPDLGALSPPSLTSSSPRVGDTITVNPGTWNTPGLTYSYEWFRNGVQIPGVTGSSWTATADSANDSVYVWVTASHAGYEDVQAVSDAVTISDGDAPIQTAASKITVSGINYSVSTGTWNVSGLTLSYQWVLVNDGTTTNATGAGATSETYTRAGSDTGTLEVIITATREGYASAPPVTITGPTLVPEA